MQNCQKIQTQHAYGVTIKQRSEGQSESNDIGHESSFCGKVKSGNSVTVSHDVKGEKVMIFHFNASVNLLVHTFCCDAAQFF